VEEERERGGGIKKRKKFCGVGPTCGSWYREMCSMDRCGRTGYRAENFDD
jgi:hypothetical protein